jgi:hypothetical protein
MFDLVLAEVSIRKRAKYLQYIFSLFAQIDPCLRRFRFVSLISSFKSIALMFVKINNNHLFKSKIFTSRVKY